MCYPYCMDGGSTKLNNKMATKANSSSLKSALSTFKCDVWVNLLLRNVSTHTSIQVDMKIEFHKLSAICLKFQTFLEVVVNYWQKILYVQ